MSAFSEWLLQQNQVVDERHLRRPRRSIKTHPDGWCDVDGQRLRNLASNDYLNLAHDKRLIAAAQQALLEFGVGSTSSAMVGGRSVWQDRLEKRIAEFEQREAAMLFPTGYAANLGTLSALLTADCAVLSDQLNHASLIDGCRLSKAERSIYGHNDLDDLRNRLKKTGGSVRKFIVTDGVFSMDGDLAPLAEICELADEFSATIVVDEAHGTGVYGPNGLGAADACGVHHRIDVGIGTLSKALGCLGGFVSGSHELIDRLWHSARTQFFSTALPPSVCAAACTAIEIVCNEPERRQRLMDVSSQLRAGLRECGLTIPAGSGPIIPVILQDPEIATRVAVEVRERGYFVGAIRPPTVPEGTSRLRISLSAAIESAEIPAIANLIADAVESCSV